MDQSQNLCGIFTVLQQVLKQKGITYKALARSLGVSEVTVKRMFQEQDCKMSRIMQVCEIIDVPFSDLISLLEQAPPKLDSLSKSAEQALLQTEGLLPFFMLLLNDFSVSAICQEQSLSRSDAYLLLRELEKIGLIKMGQGTDFSWQIKRPVKWSVAGPFQHILTKVNQKFVKLCIDEHESAPKAFKSAARKISPATKSQFEQAMEQLYLDFQKQASLDQLYYDDEELQSHKILLAFSSFNIKEFC